MAKRGCLPALGLGAVTMVALLVAFVAMMNAFGCCAIDCDRFPEKCAENERRQETASLVFAGALLVAVGSGGGAAYVRFRRR